jgi:hypothetical protein
MSRQDPKTSRIDGKTRYSEMPVTATQKTVRRSCPLGLASGVTSVRDSIACSSRSPSVSTGGAEGVSVDGAGVDHHPVEHEDDEGWALMAGRSRAAG